MTRERVQAEADEPVSKRLPGVPGQAPPEHGERTVPQGRGTPEHRLRRIQASAQVIIAIAVVLTGLFFAKLVLVVLLVSILLAFILAPLVEIFERMKLPKGVAAALAVMLMLAAVYAITYFSYNRGVDFAQNLPKYSGKIRGVVSRFRQQAQTIQKTTEDVLPPEKQDKDTVTVRTQTSWSEWITHGFGSVTEMVLIISFIPFLVYFMLSWQEHTRAATVMLFRMENRNTAYVTLGLISAMIRSFIVGNVLVGLFMGAISTIVFAFLKIPFFYFVGFISGFLSLVPYLGVVLAIVPPIVLGLGKLHSTGVIVIVGTVLGLHLFALNVLYPKFLGSRLQLNPLAVTLALLFWGWLWGAMGLILAIPITAAMKIIFDHVESLRAYGNWLGE